MHRANEAIVREKLPIPNVDEVLESLNGRTVVSKLDLRWDFHQIELEANSRDINSLLLMNFPIQAIELWCQCSLGEVSAYHHPDNGRSKGRG